LLVPEVWALQVPAANTWVATPTVTARTPMVATANLDRILHSRMRFPPCG
jgi:hypothetical protein